MTVTSPLEDETDIATLDAPEWSLVACSSWLTGQRFAVVSRHDSAVIKIGRGSHCDIIFPGTHLSREHVELRVEDDHIYVKDLRSVNGSYINEVRVSEGVLHPGDKLRLDVYSFKVEGPERAVKAAVKREQDANATRMRAAPPEAAVATVAAEQPKQWVTKPTSPGNREETPASKSTGLLPLWIIAGTLLITVAGLGFYLFTNS